MTTQSETMVLRLRMWRPTDIEQVYAIEKEAFECPWDREELLINVMQAYASAIVAEWEGSIVGYVMFTHDADCCYVVNLVVDWGCQRKGVGTALVDEVKKVASGTIERDVHLSIPVKNMAAQAWAKGNKFKCEQEIEGSEPGHDFYTFCYRCPH